MKPLSIICFVASIALPATATFPELLTTSSSVRAKYNFNPAWRVYVGDNPQAASPSFDDASWKNVTLPYAWNEDDAFRVDIASLPTGVAWYRKHFRVPAAATDKKLFLEFEGIRH